MQAAELFEPGEYLSTGKPGYFSILARASGGAAAQESYELRHLETVVRGLNPYRDTWITQAVFNGPNRRAVHLRDVGLLFADLDTYRSEGLTGKSPEEQAQALCLFCGLEGLPAPSIVLFSGRGLQAKWLLTEALGPSDLPYWNQAQLALVKILEPFSADTAARDVSRVLRVDRTVNTKSGETCKVVHVTGGAEKCPARYDFGELRETLVRGELAQAPRETRRQAADRPPLALPRELSFKRLNWFRLYDVRDLWKARGGVPEGFRELTLFWELIFLLRADPGKAADLWKEAEALAAEIAPGTGFYHRSDLSTLYRKAQAGLAGETVEYCGRAYPPLYTPRNSTLQAIFRVTSEEERTLRTIISREERERRRREKRWADGARPRAQALSRVRPWETEGISRALWYRKRKGV